ncbi:MAG: hypothetical protein LBI94_02570 [Treponema sp.]|jgi:hypothetical protein|nr:hypothetical protein [Treponema sp.]
MKKSVQRKAALLVVFTMIAVSFVSAQEGEDGADGGIGLTGGIEFGFGNVADKAVIGITPSAAYENSFGNFDVFAELDYTAAFDDPAAHDLYIEEEIGYNWGLIESGTLSIILNNNNTFRLKPELEDGETHAGTFEPSLKWTQGMGFGDLWLQAGLPVDYLTGVKDETALGLYTTLGWDSTFGLAAEFALNFSIKPESDFAGLGFKLSYDQGLIYGEAEFLADKEFKTIGINPEIDVNLNAFTIYARAEFTIAEDSDTEIIPAIGVKYSF